MPYLGSTNVLGLCDEVCVGICARPVLVSVWGLCWEAKECESSIMLCLWSTVQDSQPHYVLLEICMCALNIEFGGITGC